MSLDKILILFSMFDKDVLKDKVEFKNPLSKKIFICKNSSKAYVLLSPWHADKSTFYFLKNKIIKAGFSCILYSFIPDILSPDVEGTRKYFEDIEKKIKNDLVEFKKQHNIKSFVVVGFSLSCVTASMVSSSNELVDGVIFIAPGITLTEPMWYGLRTKNIRKIMEKNGVTPVCLKNQWDNLAPGKYVQGFKNKQVKILLSHSYFFRIS